MGHWGEVGDMVGAGDEDTTMMSMVSFWCLYCLPWTCFALPCAVSGFWLWRCRRLWGIICCKYIFLPFYSSSGLC